MKTVTLFLAVLGTSCVSLAQAQSNQPAGPQKTLIHAAHLLDVKSGKMLDTVAVLIVGDKV